MWLWFTADWGSRISNSCHQKFKDLNKVDAPFADWLIGGTMMHTHAESMGNLINIWFLRELVWFWFFCRSKFQKFRLFLSFLDRRFGSFFHRRIRYPRFQLAYPVSKAVFSILKRAGCALKNRLTRFACNSFPITLQCHVFARQRVVLFGTRKAYAGQHGPFWGFIGPDSVGLTF